MNFFVTGTDTGVGKTHTIVQLLRLLRATGESCAGFKPICCGDRNDAERLLEMSTSGLTIDEINPVWLKTPAAPMVAAELENIAIDPDRLIDAFNSLRKKVEHVVVEGVGGWLVPIRPDADAARTYFVSDLAAEMKLPVLVVAQNRLGCLNHTALTVENVQRHGLRCAAVVLNTPPGVDGIAEQTNADGLRKTVDVPLLTGLTGEMDELPSNWRRVIESLPAVEMSPE